MLDAIMGWEPGGAARMGAGLLWGNRPPSTPTEGPVPGPSSSTPAPANLTVHVARLGERLVSFLEHEHAEAVVEQWHAAGLDRIAEVEVWDGSKWEQEGPGGMRAIRGRVPDRKVVFHAHAVYLPGGERLNIGRPEQWVVSAWEFETDLYTDLPVRWHTRRPSQEVEAQVRGTDRAAVASAFAEACAQAVDRA